MLIFIRFNNEVPTGDSRPFKISPSEYRPGFDPGTSALVYKDLTSELRFASYLKYLQNNITSSVNRRDLEKGAWWCLVKLRSGRVESGNWTVRSHRRSTPVENGYVRTSKAVDPLGQYTNSSRTMARCYSLKTKVAPLGFPQSSLMFLTSRTQRGLAIKIKYPDPNPPTK